MKKKHVRKKLKTQISKIKKIAFASCQIKILSALAVSCWEGCRHGTHFVT